MAMKYIREQYGVPAKRGVRVRFAGKFIGTIIGSYHQYLRIRFDGNRCAGIYHPTWELEYLVNAPSP